MMELVSTMIFFSSNNANTVGIERNYHSILDIVTKGKTSKTETLHFGDSVARQLFTPKDSEGHLTTNGSILLAGQYYLLQKAIEHNPNLKTIYLGVTPGSLRAETFRPNFIQNHIKPFISLYNGRWNKDYIRPFFQTYPKTIFYASSLGKYLPVSEPKIKKRVNFNKLLSPTNKEYLIKINELCKTNNIVLHFYSPPLSAERKGKLSRLTNKMAYANPELQNLMTEYATTFRYIDKRNFKDEIHLTKKYLRKNKSEEKTIILNRQMSTTKKINQHSIFSAVG